jgi:hypothetical protein
MKIKPEMKRIVHTIELDDEELDIIYQSLRLFVHDNYNEKINSMIFEIEEVGKKVDSALDGLEDGNN